MNYPYKCDRNIEIGKRIAKIRKERHMRQQDLAILIGRTETSIRKYEKGLVNIPLPVIEAISSALEVTEAQILPEVSIMNIPTEEEVLERVSTEKLLKEIKRRICAL